jgi:hypothetical protein
MPNKMAASKADIERIEAKLDHILRAMGEVLEALKPLQAAGEVEAADWNKAFPPADKSGEFRGDGN